MIYGAVTLLWVAAGVGGWRIGLWFEQRRGWLSPWGESS